MRATQTINKAKRNERILLDIIEQYIETAEPVSSQQLLSMYKYNLSSATLRNIMVSLDEAGYLTQPHTSAGRIPTAKAYRFYVDKVKIGAQSSPEKSKIKQGVPSSFQKNLKRTMSASLDEAARMLSQQLAEATHSIAFVGLLRANHFYREGLKYLLNEPEFLNTQNIRNLVEYIDSLENRLDELYTSIQGGIYISIGEESEWKEDEAFFPERRSLYNEHSTGEEHQTMCGTPFSWMAFTQELSSHPISIPHQGEIGERVVFGIVGPMRMDYGRNLELLDEIRSLFK